MNLKIGKKIHEFKKIIKKNLKKIINSKYRKKEKWFLECFKKFKELDKEHRFPILKKDFWPCLDDNTTHTGFDIHYTYHPAWAARVLAQTKPSKHVDISSCLVFSTVMSAFIPMEFYDLRPADVHLDNLECKKADLINLPFADNSIESLSCMHTIEHVGLGRFGDEIDPDGDLKAINELKRVLKKGGDLLFVIPVGKPRIQYNAHRNYSYEMIMEYFKDLKLKEYTLAPDNALEVGMIKNATKEITDAQIHGCGCFWFQK